MAEQTLWNVGDFQYDPQEQRLRGKGKDTRLASNEASLLMVLIESSQAKRPCTKEEIVQRVWGKARHDNSLYQAIRNLRILFGEADEYIASRPYRLVVKVSRADGRAVPRLTDNLRRRIGELTVRPEIERSLRRVLAADSYPTLMTLSSESVINPIWRLIPDEERMRLSTAFSPFGNVPPRIMHLDIFLLKANDNMGRPLLFNYYSGKPFSGWQAFMLPFRHRRPGENARTRQRENSRDIGNFLGLEPRTIHVSGLGNDFVVSVKPDPGYSELVVYIFEFCDVVLDAVPEWMLSVDCVLKLDTSVRRFRWLHPEEMEQEERSLLVDGDVIRGVHYFFGTTLPAVKIGSHAILRP